MCGGCNLCLVLTIRNLVLRSACSCLHLGCSVEYAVASVLKLGIWHVVLGS